MELCVGINAGIGLCRFEFIKCDGKGPELFRDGVNVDGAFSTGVVDGSLVAWLFEAACPVFTHLSQGKELV